MFGMENEEDFKSSDKLWMWFVVSFVEMIEHVKEVFDVAKVF